MTTRRHKHAGFLPDRPMILPALILALGTSASQMATAEPRGGYLDWVFYDDLPSSERDRISSQCPGSFIDPWTDTGLSDDELSVSAGKQAGTLDGQVRLTEDVQITLAVLRLYGDEATYDTPTGQVALPIGGIIRQPDLAIDTARATAETEQNRFQLYDARYTLHMANLHGQADTITRDEAIYRLDSAWMTRCAPGDFGWSLHASTLTVNTDTNIATGYNTRLHIGPVPVAYTPYIRLNLNQERSSGFLSPSASYLSRYDQWRVSTPYYWAIAPNLDNTTRVDWMIGGDADDGAPQVAHIDQEWRYLQRRHRGELTVGAYPGWNDPNAEAAEWGLDLSLRSRHSALVWTLDYKDSNSERYFSEFLGEAFEPTVVNRVTAGYVTDTRTRIDMRVEDQAIFGEAAGSGDLSYVERPGLHLRQPINLPYNWNLQGLADWERRFKAQPEYLSGQLNITAADPYEAYRLRNRLVFSRSDTLSNWTFSQQYTGDHTYYTLPDFATDELDEHPLEGYNRLLWDTRHRLSYRFELPQQQTLTPFVQHEYRPLDEQQVDLPLMNTSVDRLRDRNRITLGNRYQVRRDDWVLTSDLQQVFNLSKELLGDTAPLRTDDWTNPQAGNISLNNRIQVGNLHSLGALLAWGPERPADDLSFYGDQYEAKRFRFDYTFTPRLGGISLASDWNLANETNNNPLRTMEVAAVVPVSPVIGVFGYVNWEQLNDDEELAVQETVIGLEYDGCCWNVQLAGQRFVNSELEESSGSGLFDTIQLNLNLKGLGSVGGRRSMVQRVRDRIPTFSDRIFDTQ